VGTRLSAALELECSRPLVTAAQWNETRLVIPRHLVGRSCVNVFHEGGATLIGARVIVSSVLTNLPVALLEAR
jgi:maltooligosyltrehalose synthase